MSSVEYIAPTKRKGMNRQRRTRIFLENKGICCLCGGQIIAHKDDWFIEHPEAVNLGGSDDDKDLRPAHVRCKPAKDAADAKLISKRNAIIDKHCADAPKGKPMPCGRNSPYKKTMSGRVVPR